MKNRIPIIALTLLLASSLTAEPPTQPATKVVGPSDVLHISVLNLLADGLETVLVRQVSKDGYIHLILLPKKIKVEGLTENQVRDAVAKAYASEKVLSNPSVKVKFPRPPGGATLRDLLLESLATLPAEPTAKPATQPVVREYVRRIRATLPKGWSVETEKDTVIVSRKKPVEWYGLLGLPTHDKAKLKAMGGFVHSMTYSIKIRFAPPMSKAEAARLKQENQKTRERYYRKHPINPRRKSTAPPAELTDALHPIPDILNDRCSMFLYLPMQWYAFYDKADEAECRKVERAVLEILKSNKVKDRKIPPATKPVARTDLDLDATATMLTKVVGGKWSVIKDPGRAGVIQGILRDNEVGYYLIYPIPVTRIAKSEAVILAIASVRYEPVGGNEQCTAFAIVPEDMGVEKLRKLSAPLMRALKLKAPTFTMDDLRQSRTFGPAALHLHPATQPGLQQRAEELIRQRQCAENLRKIAEALQHYANNDTDPVPWTLTNPAFQNPTTAPAAKPSGGAKVESRVLEKAAAELLAEVVVAQWKATGKFPEGATKPEFVVEFLERLKSKKLDPDLLKATPEQEKAFARGDFDDKGNSKRLSEAIKQVNRMGATLPGFSRHVVAQFQAGKLAGAKLEFACRLMEMHVRFLRASIITTPATRPATQPAVETPKSRVAQKRLRQKTPKVTFNKNKLADTIQFLRDVSNLNIVVNWKSLKSAKINKATLVSLNLLNPSMKDVMEWMLENARNSAGGNVAPDYIVDEEGVITISMPKHLRLGCKITLPERPTEKSRRTHKTLMQTLPKLELPDVDFADVLQFLRELISTRIVVDWKAMNSVGIDKKTPVNLYLIDVPGKKVLEKTLELAGGQTELSCVIDKEGVIQISTKKTATTTSAPAVDPKVMAILKRLEAAGDKYPNITAKIDYKVDMLQYGDTEERTGRVYYQGPGKKDSAKFRIHFDTLRQGTGPRIKDVVDYAFDGAWLTVRKQRIKQMSRYQVAPPGKKVNPLQLGKGPFPVPFGQKADTVIKHFRATTRPTRNTGVPPVKKHGRDGHATLKTDPKNTDYIKLTTRRRYHKEFSVVWLEMWIDRKTSLPVKIIAEDRSEDQTTVIFKDTKTPKSFPKKTFNLPRPPAGWEYHVEKYKGRVK